LIAEETQGKKDGKKLWKRKIVVVLQMNIIKDLMIIESTLFMGTW